MKRLLINDEINGFFNIFLSRRGASLWEFILSKAAGFRSAALPKISP